MKKWIGLLLGLVLLTGAGTGYYLNKNDDVVRIDEAIPLKKYDVIVVGGEPEGVAAAVASARAGAKTLLLVERGGLGGLFTYGELNFLDLGLDKDKKPANAGIFKEWHKMVDNQISFDIDKAEEAFDTLVKNEKNITLQLETEVEKVELNDEQTAIHQIQVKNPDGVMRYQGKRYIDTTAHADFAALAKVPYFIGQEDIGKKETSMSVTLMMHFKNVDWSKVYKVAKDKTFGEAVVQPRTAYGFWGVVDAYKPVSERTRLRGLNIARVTNGDVYINALQIFGTNGLDEESNKEAIEIGKEETNHVLTFLRENFPGFENAEIADYPEELYVRETRHIEAEYQLPISDVWEYKDHWDSIAFGSYPVDVQATDPDGEDYVILNPKQYAIPFRSLVPKKMDNLLVASKASGYSSLAAGSARIVPTGMSTAEAAGVASVLSYKNDMNFREMSKDKKLVKQLQDELIVKGAHLYHFDLNYLYEGKWFYPAVKDLYTRGLLFAGYENDLKPNEPFTEDQFVWMVKNGVERTDPKRYKTIDWPEVTGDKPLTRNKAARWMFEWFIKKDEHRKNPWVAAAKRGYLDDEVFKRVDENRPLLKKESYALVSGILKKVEKK
ncbi:FAD-dependent oxidoreductase [Fictibacillus phosphorivorans]|uniref:FAD-dependent oxidoreductase n=1 Tax=Fictibacillus phosphorivorans TaxID=1221500 RepID=UPI00203A6762|nr:FAD-dependent oxidoreductase [Fictibacillus phosphorivorans]MCM3718497.1 FAD-dependent oxidoreductase [Fictibacillus phosphorivorans]MCM3776147.1 FAD-dependent oxidoreductase [Fictibacillus phosphorivorans]